MKRIAFSVFDSKAMTFGQPMFVSNTAVMFRMMKDEVAREGPDNMLNRHPEDFGVYAVGSFDDETGVLQGDVPTVVFACSAFVEVKGSS